MMYVCMYVCTYVCMNIYAKRLIIEIYPLRFPHLGLLGDEMGLGKTVQTIAMLGLLAAKYNIKGPHLVVAPASTLENWRRELNKWLPNARVCLYHGSQKDRAELQRVMSPLRNGSMRFDVLVTSYTYFERESCGGDRSFFNKFRFEYTAYDEAHAIKSMGSARYRRLVKLRSKHRLLLTGEFVVGWCWGLI
jgi:SNF2 family DNA or RNA helicase